MQISPACRSSCAGPAIDPKPSFPPGTAPHTSSPCKVKVASSPHEDGRVLGRHLKDEGCLDYALDLEGLAEESRLGFHLGSGRTALIKSSTWLWQPPQPSADLELSASFTLPAQMQAATSWTVDETGTHHFDRSAFEMRSFTMLGRLSHQRFSSIGRGVRRRSPRAPHRTQRRG